MDQDKLKKLNELLSTIEITTDNQEKIEEIKNLIQEGNLQMTLQKIDELFSNENNEEDVENEKKKSSGEEDTEVTVKRRRKKEEQPEKEKDNTDKYPKELQDENLEYIYIGLLLNHPKYITKYYFLYEECLFENEELLNF